MTRTPACVVGLTVTHRRYVTGADAHYAGGLVDGAFGLSLFGDAATELCIRSDEDEGLFASYQDVQFVAPVRSGDLVEVEAVLVGVGQRSREIEFTLRVVARGTSTPAASSAAVLDPVLVATTARGICVVPG